MGKTTRWIAGAIAVGLAWTAVPAASAGARPAPEATSRARLPEAVDFAAIHAEQIQVVTRDYQAGIDHAAAALSAATAGLSRATTTLDNARSTLASDTAASSRAASRAAAAASTLAATTARHQAAQVDANVAVATLGTDRDRLSQVALALYLGPPPTVPDVPDIPAANVAADGLQYLDTSRREVTATVHQDVRQVASTHRHERQLAARVAGDSATLGNDTLARERARAVVATDTATVAADRTNSATAEGVLAVAQKALIAARGAQTVAVAALGAPAPDGSPTILGTPALAPTQLAGWFKTGYYNDVTAAPVAALTGWYVNDGIVEGVRGDVAFAQAIVETGGFASPDAVSLNNYAGIGHCDSCGTGLAFPDPRSGVIGQLQVLHVFASPFGTPLPTPPVIPAVAPGGVFLGGCCASWQSLTGHYATDPNYGNTVLSIYKSMLDYALSQPPVAPNAKR